MPARMEPITDEEARALGLEPPAGAAPSGVRLEPVDYDPFEGEPPPRGQSNSRSAAGQAPRLEPVTDEALAQRIRDKVAESPGAARTDLIYEPLPDDYRLPSERAEDTGPHGPARAATNQGFPAATLGPARASIDVEGGIDTDTIGRTASINQAGADLLGVLQRVGVVRGETDIDEHTDIMADVKGYNDRVRELRPVGVTFITDDSLRDVARNALRPSKAERER